MAEDYRHDRGAWRWLRGVVVAAVLLGACAGAQSQSEPSPERPGLFQQVTERARSLAEKPYQAPQPDMPAALTELDYDGYRQIRFRPDSALWKGESPFEVQLFHPGFLYREPVTIHLVEDGQVRTVPFDPALFRYDGGEIFDGPPPENLGYAGFRVHFPMNDPDYADEVVAFLGASYFRFVGREQVYGLSTRGLAIDTALPSGEEFPSFREFWLVRPDEKAAEMTVYALLDSPSLAGAYRFDIAPGAPTAITVEQRLFARENVQRLGIAPLTSMFLYGENKVDHRDDFRPEVHDSDGLLMHTAGDEWIWRPLTNPKSLRESALMDTDPRGFGLFQRDRRFQRYLDLEAAYHRRPSVWVEPLEPAWGKGAVHLVEIPTKEEVNDNIVAFWSPKDPLQAGESMTTRYRLTSLSATPQAHDLGRTVRTRIGWAAIPGQKDPPPRSLRQFIVDFRGGELDSLVEGQPVTAHLETSTGLIQNKQVHRLPDGGWRASFRLAPESGKPADMRMHLTLRGKRLTETWNYLWDPNALP